MSRGESEGRREKGNEAKKVVCEAKENLSLLSLHKLKSGLQDNGFKLRGPVPEIKDLFLSKAPQIPQFWIFKMVT